MDFIERIAEALRKPGKSGRELSRLLHKPPNVISRIVNRERRVQLDEIDTICRYLEIDRPAGVPGSQTTVPIIGELIREGNRDTDQVKLYRKQDVCSVSTPLVLADYEKVVAIHIVGDGIGLGLDGCLFFYEDKKSEPEPRMMNRLCIVCLPDDRIFLKVPRAGWMNKFDLMPVGRDGEPILQTVVKWMSPMLHLFLVEQDAAMQMVNGTKHLARRGK